MNIDETLAERGKRYGDFGGHAEITQSLKTAMYSAEVWDDLPDDMKEALEMTAHKIGRILNGDPNYIDSWTDIIGYIRLVEKRLLDEQDDKPCNDPACPACNPEISAAIDTLMKAGILNLKE